VRLVAHDTSNAMRPESLEQMVRDDMRNGRKPCAVVATTGTTTSTALDPVAAIARVTVPHGMWLHVDAAMAGSAMILPECRWMWDGVEQADSVIVNAHKWLGAVFDATLYFVRDPEHLVRVMSTNPSYLQTAADGRVKNYRDWGLPLGRRFRALKLWFLIREQGVERLQARLRRDIANAKWLAAQIAAAPDWRVLAPVPLQTLCVRHQPRGLAGEALDQHTLDWVARLNQAGQAYLTPAMLDGRWMVRVSVGAELTEREHVAQLWTLMKGLAQ
jgi:aromatic-L-amino-acid decarboxylase